MTKRDSDSRGSEAQVHQIATELSRIRQRGVDDLDLQWGSQKRVQIPLIEAIADRNGFDVTVDRPGQVADFLTVALASYSEQSEREAYFIRELLFDVAMCGAPGSTKPSELLRRARSAAHLSEAAFRKVQRQHFLDFGKYLLSLRRVPPKRFSTAFIIILVALVSAFSVLVVLIL